MTVLIVTNLKVLLRKALILRRFTNETNDVEDLVI